MRKRKGRFITFEGIEGCGKSTCSRWAAMALRGRGFQVDWTREPGGTSAGRILRRILLDAQGTVDPVAELILYCADRRLHAASFMLPRLREGHIVISDRYTDSTLAYQGGGRGLSTPLLRRWVLERSRLPKPDLTLLLDLPVEIGLRRAATRGMAADRMELEARSFHERVRRAFLKLAEAEPRRIVIVDAARPLAKVKVDVRKAILSRLSI